MGDPSDTQALEKIRAITEGMSRTYEEMDSFRSTLGVLAGSLGVSAAFQIILNYVGSLHLGFGIFTSIIMILIIIYLVKFFKRRSFLASTRSACAIFLTTGLFFSVIVASWVTYTLYTFGVGLYDFKTPPSLDDFNRLYFYTLADMIPGLEIAKTLHLTSPVEPRDTVAGCLILVFRIAVLWFLFAEFKGWQTRRKEEGKNKPGDVAVLLSVMLIFIVVLSKPIR